MHLNKLRRYLLEKGIVQIYTLFMAGYFVMPMAAGHRRLYYLLVMPSIILLWQELRNFYRDNLLFGCVVLYTAYLLSTLVWTECFDASAAAAAVGFAAASLSFCILSGFLWVQYPKQMDRLARHATWLAAAAALASILAWYYSHPLPQSRLEPLWVMHHPNKAGCAYGIIYLFSMHYFFSEHGRHNRAFYFTLATVLLALILLTQSRTALAATCVALLALAGLRAAGIIAVSLAASWTLLAANPQDWLHRVRGLSFRPGIWVEQLYAMKGNWLFGHGILSNSEVAAYDRIFPHAHNGYIATLRDGGLIGLALMLLVLVVALTWASRLACERGERIYLAMILYGMTCISMDFDRLLTGPRESWLFFWLPVAMIMASYPHRHNPDLLRYRTQRLNPT